tara:strand:+ start:10369 stop:11040 length:672 start_codon:yes stop_codon:yes gene_type:complete
MRFICLIPARKNSKRLKNKNFINLKGKPLVEWTLNLSNKIKFFNQIVLSTDNKKIFKLNKKYPKILFLNRPKNISKGTTRMSSVITHALSHFKKQKKIFDAVVILQPTSPFRKVSTIIKAIKKFKKYKPDYLTTVIKLKHFQKPHSIFTKKNNRFLQSLNLKLDQNNKGKDYFSLDGGGIFIFRLPNKNYKLKGKAAFVEVKFPESIDIDSKEDFEICKKFYN